MAEIYIPIMSISAPHGNTFGLALHPILPILATGSAGRRADNNAYLFRFNSNLRSSTCVATLQGHSQSVSCVAFHRTFPIIATGSNDYTAKLWLLNSDCSEARCIATLEGHTRCVNSVAFHPTFPILATGSNDYTTKLWHFNPDGSAASCVATLEGHTGSVFSVEFHPTLPILATGSDDHTAKLWRLKFDDRDVKKEATCFSTLRGHRDFVFSVAFNAYLPILATGSGDNTAKLWQFNPDGSAASCIATLQGHTRPVYSVAFHAIFPILVTGSADHTAKFWRLNSDNSAPSCVATLRGHYNWVYCVKFHASLPILSSIAFTNSIKLWLLNTEGIVVDSTEENIEEFLQQYKHPAIRWIGGSLQNESRFFKLVSVNGKEVDGGRYELPSKTKSGKAQTRGPKDKASFAFSEICKKNNKKGECSYKFAIQETTRGSNKKVYHYEGKRVKLTKPIVLELKDKKTGKVKKVVKKYKNIIVAIH
jgi:WD40 repeat protein